MLNIYIYSAICYISFYTQIEITVTKNQKVLFSEDLLNKQNGSLSRFLDQIMYKNLPASFQIYALLIRNQTACFGKKGFLFLWL